MFDISIKKIAAGIALSSLALITCACSPLVPENYLGPSNIRTSQKVDDKWIQPRLIPISTQMLSTHEGQELLAPAMRPQPYRIGAYDNLNIIVWGHPDLSTVATSAAPLPTYGRAGATSAMPGMFLNQSSASAAASNPAVLVESDGSIFYPYVGKLHVSGLTVQEAQGKITHRLRRYLRDPQVTVQVAKYRNRNVYVLGEVVMPGMQPITDKPLALMEAISASGGIDTRFADPKHIYVIRGSYIQPDVFWLNATSPQTLMIAEQFPLQENDIIYVSSATFTGVNRFLNQVLPSLTAATTAYAIAKGIK